MPERSDFRAALDPEGSVSGERGGELGVQVEPLRRLARRLLYDSSAADDVVQDAWMQALHRRPRRGSLRAWMLGVVRNLANSRNRDTRRRTLHERGAARSEAVDPEPDSFTRLETLERVVQAVRGLEDPYRTVLLLRFFDGLTPREIGKRQGLPTNTVRTHLRRGLERLRRRLDPGEHGGRDDERMQFLSALVPLAGPMPWAVPLGLASKGGLVKKAGLMMGTKTQFACVCMALAALTLVWQRPWSAPLRTPGTPETLALVDGPDELAVDPAGPAEDSEPAVTAEPVRQPTEVAAVRRATIEGQALRGYESEYPGALVQLELFAGYGTEGERLRTTSVRADERGSFRWSIDLEAGAGRAATVRASAPPSAKAHVEPVSLFVIDGEAVSTLALHFHPFDIEVFGRLVDPEGRPVPNGVVGSFDQRDLGRTDEEGRFRIPGSSTRRSILIYAHAAGFAEADWSLIATGESVSAGDLVLHPGLRAHGVVTDEQGLPIAGAWVSNTVFDFGHGVHTDAEGRYSLEGLDPEARRTRMVVTMSGYASWSQLLEQGAGDVRIDPVLSRGHVVSGTVVDPEGSPVEGARLTLGWSPLAWPRQQAIAGYEGRFRIEGVAAGQHNLWVRVRDYATHVEAVEVDEEDVGGVQIRLQPGKILAGRVVDREGSPVAWAMVFPRHPDDWNREYVGNGVRTDANGQFRLAGLPTTTIALDIRRAGYTPVQRKFSATELNQDELEIVLEPAGRLAGRVIDGATGKPIDDFVIRFTRPFLEPGERQLYQYDHLWKKEGKRFVGTQGEWDTGASRFPIGTLIAIEASAPGYGPTLHDRVVIEETTSPDALVLRMWPPSTIRGTVVDADSGVPIEGAIVRRYDRGRNWSIDSPETEDADIPEARTARDGSFSLPGAGAQGILLRVRAEGYAPGVEGPIELSAGKTSQHVISLIPGASLVVTALDAAGQPVSGATIGYNRQQMRGQDGERARGSAQADERGRVSFGGLPAGTYRVYRMHEHAMGSIYGQGALVEVEQGKRAECELRPGGRATLRGRLVFDSGVDAADMPSHIAIGLYPKGEPNRFERQRATIAVDGDFELSGLEAGRYQLRIMQFLYPSNSELTALEEIEIGEEQTLSVDVPVRLESED